MARKADPTVTIDKAAARRIWLRAQRLDTAAPFGDGPEATRRAVEHLGYVQIDTIHVIERCHHHILFTRIPAYRRADLHQAQNDDRSVFEAWTHALAYVPTRDFSFAMPAMTRQWEKRVWFPTSAVEVRKVIRRIRDNGPLSIRDIDDDVLVEKDHPWASRKPSKRALQTAFLMGKLTISAREGMVKTYELTDRHFGWDKRPKSATERQTVAALLDRALTAQGLISLDSACYQDAPRKAAMLALIEAQVRRKRLVPVAIDGVAKPLHWARPEALEPSPESDDTLVHILSPFDPLIIQRKRLNLYFDYDHRFEAYVPKEKRVFGYFALPVLVGDRIVAAIDLKTDRAAGTVRVQKWSWVGSGSARAHKRLIEEALTRFTAFQLGG